MRLNVEAAWAHRAPTVEHHCDPRCLWRNLEAGNRGSSAFAAMVAEQSSLNVASRPLSTTSPMASHRRAVGFAGKSVTFNFMSAVVVELVPLALYDELAGVRQVGTDGGVA